MLFSFVQRRKRYVLLIAYLLLSLFLMVIGSSSTVMSIKAFFFSAFSGVNKVFNEVNGFTGDIWNSIRKMNELRKELQTAYQKIQLLQDAGIEIENLRKENDNLKALLSYRKEIKFPSLPAEIVAKDPKSYFSTVIVDKGRADGVQINMPVIGYQDGKSGVVGKIVECGMHASKVLLLTDRNSYISANLYSSGFSGLVRGNGLPEHYLDFLYVDRNAMLNFGDLVVTSGQGGIFPKGVNIGAVVSVKDAKYGFYYNEIKVLPIIDFSKLEAVFILLKPGSPEVKALTEDRE
jgi:rod shape-determining protein MreC